MLLLSAIFMQSGAAGLTGLIKTVTGVHSMGFFRGIFRFVVIIAVCAVMMHACGQEPARLNQLALLIIGEAEGPANSEQRRPPENQSQPSAGSRFDAAEQSGKRHARRAYGNLTETTSAARRQVRKVVDTSKRRGITILQLSKPDADDLLAKPGWYQLFTAWLNHKLLADRNRSDEYSTRKRPKGRAMK